MPVEKENNNNNNNNKQHKKGAIYDGVVMNGEIYGVQLLY